MQQPNPRLTAASLAGAVDLSSLRKPPPTPQAAPGQASPSPNGEQASSSAYVIDVTEETFQAEIMDRSMTTPVVIDFWAEWCGPCKQLSPVLERLAEQADGAWILAKIDVDANQRLATAFRVQGIPYVVAIVAGQPIDAFAGVPPQSQLEQWIASVVKVAGGEPPVVEAELDPRLAEAEDHLDAGDFDAAEAAYRAVLAETPNEPLATSGLAQLELFRRLESVDPAAALAADDDDVPAQLLAADVEFASGEAERAFARLVGLVRRTAGDERSAVRDHLLSLFAIAAPDDPVVVKARRDLTSALF